MLDLKYNAKGSIVDGRLMRQLDTAADDIETEVGEYAVDQIRRRLDRVLRNPTGFYRSRVQVETLGDRLRVTDSGVIYGPWLEGVSRRNQSTRFKGYKTFRLVAQDVRREAARIAADVVRVAVGRS